MKCAFGLVVLSAVCVPLVAACGSPENTSFFGERGGARDPGAAGARVASGGSSGVGTSNEGGTMSEPGDMGGTVGEIGGRASNGEAGKNSAGSAGEAGMSSAGAGDAAGAGTAGKPSNGTGGASAGAGGKPSTGGGSGGTGGALAGAGGAAGANAGNGGAASGAGGVSGWNGWSGSGGWNWGGSSGADGSAGASACPASPPQKGDTCDVVTSDSCFYAGQACSCLSTASGPFSSTKRWACYGDGASCPDSKPVAGSSCKQSADAECPYPGNDYCVCSGGNLDAHWVCQVNPPTCTPVKPPVDACSAVKTCSWGTNKDVACFCNGTRWGCEGGF